MPTTDLRLLAVHAHPDDESSKGAATMARYRDEGVDVLVATLTGGEQGSILNPELTGDPAAERDMSGLRHREMARAAAALGVRQTWVGFSDSGLPEGDPLPPVPFASFSTLPLGIAAEPLVRLVRSFRPHVMTTYNEQGGYPHPDHIMCHRVAVEAFEAAGDPLRYPASATGPGGEGAWQPLKLYYDQVFSLRRYEALEDAMVAEGLGSPFGEWLAHARRRAADEPQRPATTRIRAAEYFPRRDAALLAHASQIDPHGSFFAVPRDLEARVWPWEEFELARSLVDTDIPEDDLFAGIRGL